MNTTTQKRSNDLRHTINTTDKDGNTMHIHIRLNDECKNGHQDFAITAEIWEKGKPKIDNYHIMSGCCHDEILAVRTDLKTFVDLHLCDYKGIPMHAIANGFYHLREGFNEVKPGNKEFKTKFCEYYRVTPEQFDVLNTAENKIQYATKAVTLGVLEQWEKQANEAIKLLEEMTGIKFLVDSKRTQWDAPTPEQIAEEKVKQESGYYTHEAKEQRRKETEANEMLTLLEEERIKIEAIRVEYAILGQVLQLGGKKALKNCIYYTHNKTLAFNWKGYDRISDELITKIIAEIKLPQGVTIENKNK